MTDIERCFDEWAQAYRTFWEAKTDLRLQWQALDTLLQTLPREESRYWDNKLVQILEED